MTSNSTSERLNEMSPVKRALVELREMRARLDSLEGARKEPIAVIGMGCRFPGGANHPDEYWQLLLDGFDAIAEVPAERWDVDEFYDPDPEADGKISTRWGGFLKDIDQFDPQFFGISPREAVALDPQQRLLMEVSWEALEHAGQAPDQLAGSPTGVFVGISISDYYHLLINGEREAIDVYLATGAALSVASGRLSYLLGLQGPALSIDTACSSSLVAIHQAVQSLRNGECRMALAGGVNIVLLPELLINFSRARMVSPDGRCKTFDARADGFVRSEGCGIVVLKRLSDALENGDNILGIIRGTAINQDGRSSGLTAPNGPSQEAVIRAALANGDIQSHQVSYVEAHGTGTSLGDPIEVQALAAALGQGRTATNRLQIGSVKTNLGHLESAAGIAGFMKAVLVLQHKEIPPHLHLQQLNPYIPWSALPVDVTHTRRPLHPVGGRYICGVSAFGFSGTNAHVILEAYSSSEVQSISPQRPVHLLTLSAKQPSALEELAKRYSRFLEDNTTPFTDICFTANAGRAHLSHRLAIVAASAGQAREMLSAFAKGSEFDGLFSGQTFEGIQPEVAFLFTGHGSHYPQMGRQLYETQPAFRSALEECDELLRPYLECSILSVLYDPAEQARMDQMAYSQPILFAFEYALAQVWRSWGIIPSIVLGHSVGEYVAACIAGAFNLRDGLKLVAMRGRLMDELPQRGAMAAVFASEQTVAEVIHPYAAEVSIAAINGPQNITISGASQAIQAVIEKLKTMRIKSQRLAVSQAAHSPLLDPILDEIEQVAAGVQFHELHTALISGMTGKLVSSEEVSTAGYWRNHFRQPVRFTTAIQTLHQEGHSLFVEIGPNPTLLAMGRRCLPAGAGVWLPSLRQGWEDWQMLLESLAALYVQGVKVDWEGFGKGDFRRRVPLPTYPWSRQRYWPEQLRPAKNPASTVSLWESVIEAGRQQEQLGPLDLQLQTYPQKWELLDRITSAYILRALRELDVFSTPGESQSAASLVSQFNFLPGYRKLLQRWLQRLERAGYLRQEGENYICRQPLPDSHPDALAKESYPELQDLSILVDYINRSGEKLVRILSGAESPLDVLFPGGSFETAVFIYQEWPLLTYYNSILRVVIQSIVRQTASQKKLRILEVGAGSGGTTSYLLPSLPPDRTHYQFTDVSELFLNRAKDQFINYPFIQYGLLDLDNDPQAQGYQPHGFDVIVAANVLHATRDLHQTLARITSLLAPGGLLLAFEVTEHLSWFDVTTALIEGMGRFEDDLREDTPFLSTTQWVETLRLAGFEKVSAFPSEGTAAEILGSHIFIAQTPPIEGSGQAAFQSMQMAEPAPQTMLTPQAGSNGQEVQEEFINSLALALPTERQDLLVDYVRRHLAKILRIAQPQSLDRRQRLMDLGVDSLMAVELKSRLQAGLNIEQQLPSTLIYDYPTIEAVAGFLEGAIFGDDEHSAGTLPGYPTGPGIAGTQPVTGNRINLDELSETEVESLLLKKLKDL